MSLEFACPQCAKRYKVSESYAGRTAQCKACGAQMIIPAAAEPEIVEPEIQAAEPEEQFAELGSTDGSGLLDEWANSPEASETTLAPLSSKAWKAKQQEPASGPAARPAKSRKRTVGIVLPEKMVRAALPLLIAGGVLFYIGYREWRLASLSHETPQQITLAKLAADGPGDNIYLDLSEFRLLPDLSVIESDGDDLEKSNWSYVWIPAVPRGTTGNPRINEIKVIVGTKSIRNARGLGGFCSKTTLRGLVVNETDNLPRRARDLLNEGLAGIDADSCYFFRVGQNPTSGTLQAFLLIGGVLLFLAGAGIGGIHLWTKYAAR